MVVLHGALKLNTALGSAEDCNLKHESSNNYCKKYFWTMWSLKKELCDSSLKNFYSNLKSKHDLLSVNSLVYTPNFSLS